MLALAWSPSPQNQFLTRAKVSQNLGFSPSLRSLSMIVTKSFPKYSTKVTKHLVKAITATTVFKCGLAKIAWKIASQLIQDVIFFVDKHQVLTHTGKFCGVFFQNLLWEYLEKRCFLAINILQTSKLMFNQFP